jgi:hypothetical protein
LLENEKSSDTKYTTSGAIHSESRLKKKRDEEEGNAVLLLNDSFDKILKVYIFLF